MGLIAGLNVYAVQPVTDNMPGLPGQSDEYWAELRKEQAIKLAQTPATTKEEQTNFYTGKPYDAELGTYIFKFRNYNPEIQRWTTTDPSGFPDGANNYCYASNTPFLILDNNGLTGKSVLWIYAFASTPYATNWGQYTDMQSEFNDLSSLMQTLDSTYITDSSRPHYLDDGDIFEFRGISSINELQSISNYDQIYIAAHGGYTLTNSNLPDTAENRTYTGGYIIGSHVISEAALFGYNSTIQMVYGCNPQLGEVDAGSIAFRFKDPTMGYLRE